MESVHISKGSKGATFAVHVMPRGRKSEVLGTYGDAIKIRVAAPPVEGAANEELIRFLAEALGVAKNKVEITSGQTARGKVVQVAGVEPSEVLAKLLGGD